MENTSNTKLFRDMESKLLNKLALKGARNTARIIGVNESQITVWQRPVGNSRMSMLERIARFLVAIEYDKSDSTVVMTGEDAKALIQMLEYVRYPKRKTPAAGTAEASNQIELTI